MICGKVVVDGWAWPFAPADATIPNGVVTCIGDNASAFCAFGHDFSDGSSCYGQFAFFFVATDAKHCQKQ